jgi:flagellar L-ring protein precursor FlgH
MTRFLIASLLIITTVAACPGATPAQAPVARPATPDSTTAQPHRKRTNWLTDSRAFKVGDVFKVAINEYALAQANKSTVSEASRERQMGMGGSMSMEGGTGFGPVDGAMETSDRGASRSRGEASRGSRYVAEVIVRVVSVTPEGLLQVKGTKVIDVDKAKQEITVTGFVQPQDIDTRDVVESGSVADARIVYTSKGLDKPKSGIVGRIVGIIWP